MRKKKSSAAILLVFGFLGAGCTQKTMQIIPPDQAQVIISDSKCPSGITYNATLEKCETAVESIIQRILPAGSILREIKPLVTYTDQSQAYIGIYIENPNVAVYVPSKESYTSCPEQTVGQSINGIYHVFLYQSGRILSDKIIPISESGSIADFPLKNTKINNFTFFNGPPITKDEENELATTDLINLKDYTGDGAAHEFILYGAEMVCGHIPNLVLGYDQANNQILFYPVRDGVNVSYWTDNFKPDQHGSVRLDWNCGDHGSETETHKYYAFDARSQSFILIKNVVKACTM